MELHDLQVEELNILRECLKLIDKYQLRYFILGGTFLGAIRHKGFIPWDDDIDIGLPRPDYEKFVQICKNELPENLKIISFKEDDEYKKYFVKVINKDITFIREDTVEHRKINLWIDVFPIDGMPDNVLIRFIHSFRLLYARLMLQYSNFKHGVNIKKKRPFYETVLIKLGYVVSKILKLDTKKQLCKIDRLLTRYDYEKSKYVVNFMGAYKFKEMFPKTYYDHVAKYPFEDLELCGAGEYHEVLTQMYGDYMTPPKEEHRISHSVRIEK